MLDQFRSLSGSLPAKILLVLLVLSFSVWGIGDMLRHPGGRMAVANVGSTTITAEEFAHALHRESENIRRMMGDHYSPEMVKSLNLPQQVLHQLITHALVAQESQSLGLIPGDAEVVRQIRSNPMFQDKKSNFDRPLFEAVIRNMGMSEKNYVEQLRQDMASGLLIGTLSNSTTVSDIAVRTLYNAQQEQRTVTVYKLTPSLVASMPPADETQIAAYYNDHKSEFTAPEYRSVSYVTISPADIAATAVSEDELKAAYKDRADEFKRPERRTVEQLLYSSQEKAQQADALLKSGKAVAQIAKDTEILNKNAVSLGKVDRNNILPDAADAVFALPVGGHTAPIASPFGWHIFTVTAIEAPSVAPFDEVRPQLEKELKQSGAGDAQSKLANKLEDSLAGGATLAETANELKLKLHAVGPMDAQGNSPDGGKAKDIPDFDKFLTVAFKTDDKSESSLLTAKGGVYYILRIDNMTPERVRTLEEVRSLVVASWQKEEREKRLAQLAKDIGDKFANASGRAAVIAQYNLTPAAAGAIKRSSDKLGDFALPSQLVSDSFAHKPQESTAAYPLKNGDYALAVVGAVLAAAPPANDAALSDIRGKLTDNVQNEILEEYTRYLARKYSVSINDAALAAVAQ